MMRRHTPPLKILKASAGSGKTFSLTVHYLLLLFSGERTYREILAVTFTNKATAEMKGRILEVLEGLARGVGPDGRDIAADYRKAILEHFTTWDDTALQLRAASAYRYILHDYSRFSVSTIDGFVQKVIRGFTFELGIDAGYKLEMNLRKVKNDLVLRLNRLLDERPDLLQWVMDYAQACIDRDDNWNYRHTLSELAGELFREHFQDFDRAVSTIPGEELFVSLDRYTKETISRFETEFGGMLGSGADMVVRAGVTVADLNQKSRNYLGKLNILVADDPCKAVEKLNKYIHAPEEWQKGGPVGPVAVLYAELNPLLDRLRDYYTENSRDYYLARAIRDNLYYLRLMKEMSNLLAGWRKDNSAQLISDAQTLLNQIGINEAGDPTFIWEKTGQRYRHFLFDEFQDTSRKQWDNFRPLLVNALAAAAGEQTEHLMVGDVKQSIYRWRNGDWRILLDRAEQELAASFHLPESGSLITRETLEVNFRSRANVVAFNNLLFTHAPGWVQQHINGRVEEGLDRDLYQTWWRKAGNHDTISRAYDGSRQRLPDDGRPGGTVDVCFLPVESNQHRATAVMETALGHLHETLTGWVDQGRYQPGQIGVLVRTNAEARGVMQYLLGKQVNFEIISADALLVGNHAAVQLLISALYTVTAQKQALGYYLALSAHLYQQVSGKEGLPPEAWMQAGSGDPELLRGILPEELLDSKAGWLQVPLAELTEQLIRVFGLDRQVALLPYLFAFRDQVAAFTRSGEKGIQAFLTYWEEEGKETSLPAGGTRNAVEVITIHKSKGLAYDVVMVPFCSWELDGRVNSNLWVDTAGTPYALLNRAPVKYKSELAKSALFKAYHEEMLFSHMDALNTLYVAFTRAREHLYVMAPGRVDQKEIKNPLAGDVLWEVLQEQAEVLGIPFDAGIALHTEMFNKPKAGATVTEGWSFGSYPVSGNVRQLLAHHIVQNGPELLARERAMRQGQIVHELIAVSETPHQAALHANRMVAEGIMGPDEKGEIMELVGKTWEHPELQALFTAGYELKTEQSIIMADGGTLRPDKVFMGKDEVIVLDFKFTKEVSDAHFRQVRMYKEVLQTLGYGGVKGYIFYGFSGELKEV